MPFFYLPGNHDVSNEVMNRIWDEQFGVRYYSFLYKDVLFLCLNTQDGEGTRPFLGEEQIEWVKQELKDFPDVRWTMVFIHQPIWIIAKRPVKPRLFLGLNAMREVRIAFRECLGIETSWQNNKVQGG